MRNVWISTLALALLAGGATAAEGAAEKAATKSGQEEEKGPLAAETFAGLTLRNLGPALTSGRIADLAVDPTDDKVWWIAVASGGVWRTANAGTTWTPVFDGEGSFSIGALAIDPRNPNVVWVGTGENNNQRSVAYGDGLYRTLNGGKSWTKMGLDASEHIAKILIDPRDSRVIWVAAQGPLWSAGGDRGVYKSNDSGASWTRVLEISADTGATDIVFDPRDPDTVYAAAHQRRRHVWTYVSGGPESALYKTTDGGKSWRELEKGLPEEDLGRIGLAVSPLEPDVVYALVESERGKGGFFASTDRGESWEKRSDHVTSGNYYVEIFADPHQLDRIYSMNTFLQVSDDGGRTWRKLGEKAKHVDNHAFWIDPRDRDHYLAGCDGGLYESFDRGATWRYFENLPLTQFYRVAVDDSRPFYQVCGGTQDNNSMCGPSRTLRLQGPANEDWTITQGGDGFWTAVDPTNPDIVYAEAQYGVLTRFDRKSGENVDIQPVPGAGEEPLRWNWDAPLVLSPHSPTRLYFAANKLFRSDDRGDSWTAISPDLTRRIDRSRLRVFGRVQSPDAVARHASTSLYGNIVALAESPTVAGLLYVGTDDGLVQVSENGGVEWRRIEKFPGVPELAYVSRLVASRHDAGVVYAAFDDHKMGDFRPYLLRSADRGRTWRSIAGDLPERGTVYALAEDPADPELLFAGTEFGLWFTLDGGRRWVELTGGLPTIQVRDLAIQERHGDLVLATFGRGFYVLDDYTPLRQLDEAALEREAILFPVRTADLFVPGSRIADRTKGSLGETWWMADNPPFGASFTYYLAESWKSKKEQRREAEEKAREARRDIDVPSLDALRAEAREEDARVALVVADGEGRVVRRIEGPAKKGIQRLSWDLRLPKAEPAQKEDKDRAPWEPIPRGPLVLPGMYSARLELIEGGAARPLGEPQRFEVVPLGVATLPARDREAVAAFQRKVARLQRAVLGAERLVAELDQRLELVRLAIRDTAGLDAAFDARARALELELEEIGIALSGDTFLRERDENSPLSISERVQNVAYSSWYSTSDPTRTQLDSLDAASRGFEAELARLRALVGGALPALERELESAGAPWTPGRLPEWSPEP